MSRTSERGTLAGNNKHWTSSVQRQPASRPPRPLGSGRRRLETAAITLVLIRISCSLPSWSCLGGGQQATGNGRPEKSLRAAVGATPPRVMSMRTLVGCLFHWVDQWCHLSAIGSLFFFSFSSLKQPLSIYLIYCFVCIDSRSPLHRLERSIHSEALGIMFSFKPQHTLLVGFVILVALARPAAAFGAGNIASISKVEGQNCPSCNICLKVIRSSLFTLADHGPQSQGATATSRMLYSRWLWPRALEARNLTRLWFPASTLATGCATILKPLMSEL